MGNEVGDTVLHSNTGLKYAQAINAYRPISERFVI